MKGNDAMNAERKLPPLPEPFEVYELWGQNVDVFTADQMREYALAVREQDDALLRQAREALGKQKQVIDDCVATYAPAWCDESAVADARARIHANGFLWYAASSLESASTVLASLNARLGDVPNEGEKP